MKSKKAFQKGETLEKYVDRRINEIFNDLAVEIGKKLAVEYADNPEAMPAGAVAFELTKKGLALQEAWRKIVNEEAKP